MKKLLYVALSALVFCSGCAVYYTARVDSGVVSENIVLKKRYRIVSVEVSRTAERPLRYEQALPELVLNPKLNQQRPAVYEMIEKLYPGVFSRTDEAVPICVDMCVTSMDNHGIVPGCEVIVNCATNDLEMGRELFGVDNESVYEPSDPRHGFQAWQLPGGIFNPDPCGTFMKPFELGFAGAIIAALEKSENNGVRVTNGGKPPAYRKIYHVPPPPPTFESENGVSSPNGGGVDDAAAAVDFFMGAMGGINAMQQQKHSRNRENLQRRQAQRAARANSRVVFSSAKDTSECTATKTCGACGGSGKCWGCKGKGSYQAAANIASSSTSPARAAMAASMVNCKACGGSGTCSRCGGNGNR